VNELPITWLKTTLGQVVQYGQSQKVEPHAIPGDAWVLDLEDIERDTSRLFRRSIASEVEPRSTKNAFKAGDVLYGKLRPYLNKVVLADQPGFCTTEVVPLDAKGLLDQRYLFHWLKSPEFIDHVVSESHGMNMPRLGTAAGRAAPLVMPPLSEQQRIADKLDAILARVDACRYRIANVLPTISAFRRAVLFAASSGRLTEDWRVVHPTGDAQGELDAWLGKRAAKERKLPIDADLRHWRANIPTGWVLASVNQFAECLDRFRIPIKREKRKSSAGLYPYYGANGEVGRIDEFIFDDDLVLVTEDETFYGREKPIAYRSSGKCWVNNHAHVLRAEDVESNDYLCFALMHYDVQPWLTGTTGRAKLTQQALNSLPIPVPPKAEMREIVARAKHLLRLADRIEERVRAALSTSAKLGSAALAKAFRGELVPQDPSDEPAQAMLDRLKAQDPPEPAPRRRAGRATTA